MFIFMTSLLCLPRSNVDVLGLLLSSVNLMKIATCFMPAQWLLSWMKVGVTAEGGCVYFVPPAGAKKRNGL